MAPTGLRPPTLVALANPGGVEPAGWARWCRSINPTAADAVVLVVDLDHAAELRADVHTKLHDQLCLALFIPTDPVAPYIGRIWSFDVSGPGPWTSPPLHVGPRGFAEASPCDYSVYLRVAGGDGYSASV